MRNPWKYKSLVVATLSVLLFSHCGGGGGIVGIDGSGSKPVVKVSASGPINGFGSVIVNGVHYNTDNAKVYVRGQLAEEQDLDVGDYVVVVGEINANGEGIAQEVYYQPRVTGLVEWVDANRNRLSVMGQTVQLVEDTSYSTEVVPRNIEGFKVGKKVTVSGVLDADDVIRASRIEMSDRDTFEVFGAIKKLSLTRKTFFVDDLEVDYSGVPSMDGEIFEGRVVAISGEVINGKILVAESFNFSLDYRQLRTVENFEMTGFVKNLHDDQFNLDTLPVRLDQNTKFIGGTKSTLNANHKVRVKGSLGADDKLLASEVELLPSPDMQIYGTLQSIVPSAWGSPFLGKLQVQDHIFWVKFDTRLTGNQEVRIRFEDLRVGDSAYVSGYAFQGNLYATSIAVDNRQSEAFSYDIQGFAFAVVPDHKAFSIFNTRVITTDSTVFSDGYTNFTRNQFFGMLTNQYVQVRGYYDFTKYAMVATRVKLIYPWGYIPPPPGYY